MNTRETDIIAVKTDETQPDSQDPLKRIESILDNFTFMSDLEREEIRIILSDIPDSRRLQTAERIAALFSEAEKTPWEELRSQITVLIPCQQNVTRIATQIRIIQPDDPAFEEHEEETWAYPHYAQYQLPQFAEVRRQVVELYRTSDPDELLYALRDTGLSKDFENVITEILDSDTVSNTAVVYYLSNPHNRLNPDGSENTQRSSQFKKALVSEISRLKKTSTDAYGWSSLAHKVFATFPENALEFPQEYSTVASALESAQPNFSNVILGVLKNRHDNILAESYLNIASNLAFQRAEDMPDEKRDDTIRKRQAVIVRYLRSFPSRTFIGSASNIGFFFSQQHNLESYGDELDALVEKLNRKEPYYLAQLLIYPTIRKRYPDLFEKHKDEILLSNSSRKSFFSHTQNRVDFPQEAVQVVVEATSSLESFRYSQFFLRDVFSENSEKLQSIASFVNSQLGQISDKNLRNIFLEVYSTFILSANTPDLVFLLSSSIDKKTSLSVAASLLGLPMNLFDSIDLADEEKDSLLLVLGQMATHPNALNLFTEWNVPVKTLEIETFITWLSNINLGFAFFDQDSFRKEVVKSSKIVSGVAADTSETTAQEALVLQNEELEKMILDELRRILALENDISYEQLLVFIEKWGGDLQSLLVLTRRLQDHSGELETLSSIVSAVLSDSMQQLRYGPSETGETSQLQPLLRQVDQEKYQEVIDLWRDPAPQIHLIDTNQRIKSSERIPVGDRLTSELRTRLLDNNHLKEAFSQLGFSEEKLEQLVAVVTSYLIDNARVDDKSNITTISGLVEEIGHPQLKGVLIGLYQLFKSIPRMEQDDLRKSLEKWLIQASKTATTFPGFSESTFMREDMSTYLKTELVPEEKITRKRYYISAQVDDPKTILEIGKYPGAGSCQNYESLGSMVRALPGYIIDGHILATCVFEIETDLVLDDTGQVSVSDFNPANRTATLHASNGDPIPVQFSRPVARKMIILGNTRSGAALQTQPLYRSGLGFDDASAFIDQQITHKLRQLNDGGLSIRELEPETAITIAGSKNPFGHYNDNSRGPSGKKGESYTSRVTKSTE